MSVTRLVKPVAWRRRGIAVLTTLAVGTLYAGVFLPWAAGLLIPAVTWAAA